MARKKQAAEEAVKYPIITRDYTRRQMMVNGKLEWICETCILDYGPKMGKTVGYIVETTGTKEESDANKRQLNRVLADYGYRLAEC